jgi:hypothetical protein
MREVEAAASKVAYGFFSFTEITDPAQHAAYNAWHQLDHLPEQYPLAGIVHGQRWVSTPACRTARAVNGPGLDPVHYVTCYLMAEPIQQTLDDFFALGAELRRLDRFFEARHAHLTGPFRLIGTSAARRVRVSAEAVPYRPSRGVYVIVDALATAADDPVALLADPGVAGVWTFATSPDLTSRRWSPGRRRITVAWLDEEPLTVAARLAPAVAERTGVEFAGPFETITPWAWDWFDR